MCWLGLVVGVVCVLAGGWLRGWVVCVLVGGQTFGYLTSAVRSHMS